MASRRDNKILESKVILLGEARVGKSSIINRFINDQFDPNSKPTTIGGNQQAFSEKIIQVFNGGKIKINLWDTAGQEIFSSIVSVYYKSAQAAIVVFDLTDRNTINKAHKWIQEVQNNNETRDCKIILVGNKQDKNNERQVKTEEGQEIAKQYKIKYYETSAKNSFNIKELFSDLAEELYTDNKNANKKPSRIQINDNFKKGKDNSKQNQQDDSSCKC